MYDNARHTFQDSSWPWGLVGRIFNNRGYSGTGTLVGDRIVITAGHMVPWGDSPWWMRFVPAYFNGTSLYGAGVESYVSDVRGYDVQVTSQGMIGASYGCTNHSDRHLATLATTATPQIGMICLSGVILATPDIDNAEEPSFQQGYTINDTDGDSNGGEELETENCDLYFGNSGGPIFAWWNNGTDPRIVGVVSGQETEYKFPIFTRNDNVFASGDGFVNMSGWGRSNWPR